MYIRAVQFWESLIFGKIDLKSAGIPSLGPKIDHLPSSPGPGRLQLQGGPPLPSVAKTDCAKTAVALSIMAPGQHMGYHRKADTSGHHLSH